MAIDTKQLTVSARDIMAMPLRVRQEAASRGLLDIFATQMLPGQIASAFPSYVKNFTTGGTQTLPYGSFSPSGGGGVSGRVSRNVPAPKKEVVSAYGYSTFPDPITGLPRRVQDTAPVSRSSFVSPVQGTFAGGGASNYGDPRDGGTRRHSGTDWQAANGSDTVFPVNGKVIYHAQNNQGYGANVVILGEDGNIYRLAPHGRVGDFKVGQEVKQGEYAGTISLGHLHMEMVKPTLDDGNKNPIYEQMVQNMNDGNNFFVSTSHQKGTTNMDDYLPVSPGQQVGLGESIIAAPDQEGPNFAEANETYLGGEDRLPTAELVTANSEQLKENGEAMPVSLNINDASGLMSTVTNPTGDRYEFAPVSPEQFFKKINSDVDATALPQGMRNNNPGNLKLDDPSSPVDWDGFAGPSNSRDQGAPQYTFDSPLAGMRALARLVMNKNSGIGNDGSKIAPMLTVAQLVTAQNGLTPGNSTAAANIAKTMGIGVNDTLDLSDQKILKQFMIAYVKQEQGSADRNGNPLPGNVAASDLYPSELYDQAIALVKQPSEGNTALVDYQKKVTQAQELAKSVDAVLSQDNSHELQPKPEETSTAVPVEQKNIEQTQQEKEAAAAANYTNYIPGGYNAAAGGAQIDKPYLAQPVDGAGPDILMGETGPEKIVPRHRADDFGIQSYQMQQMSQPEPAKADVIGSQNMQQPQYLPKPTFAPEPKQTVITAEHTPIPASLRKQYADSKMENRLDNLSPIGSVYSNFGFA